MCPNMNVADPAVGLRDQVLALLPDRFVPVVQQRRDGLERRRDLYHFGPERPQARRQVDHAAGYHLRVLLAQPLEH